MGVVGPVTHHFSFNPDHVWERQGEQNEFTDVAWIEGPWIYKYKGTYYLQYSASGTQWRTYAEGYYKSNKVQGPYKYARLAQGQPAEHPRLLGIRPCDGLLALADAGPDPERDEIVPAGCNWRYSGNDHHDSRSDGMRQSPRGERDTEPTLGPSGRQERLNCWLKKRRMKVPSHFRSVASS